MQESKKNLHMGLTLVEVIVSTSIILIFLLALFGAHNLYLKSALSNGEVIKATGLAEEGLEVVRYLRNSSWTTNIAPLSLNTDYYLVFDGNWSVNTTNVYIDDLFERKIQFSQVFRDASGDMVTSGGTLDSSTLMVNSMVFWRNGTATSTKAIATYITDLYVN
jgi:type II secretory pathway pseudopilin PulG